LTNGPLQLVFLDTPGLHEPRSKLAEYMVKQVRESVADVDLAVLVTDSLGEIAKAEYDLMQRFKEQGLPAVLCVNKIDLLKNKGDMLAKIAAFSKEFEFDQVIPVSALTGDGLDILLEEIGKYAQPGPHFFEDDVLTDMPERAIAAELIREKLLTDLSDEVPHGIAVGIESMKEREDKDLIDIEATIYCEKESHKGIVIGKKGAMLKRVGIEAREELERFLGCKVNLQLWVKVKEDWRNREGLLRNLGFKET